MAPTIAEVEAARARLAGIARVTPAYPSETFSRLTGRQVVLKAENLQRTGSFKIRGAYNTIATLGEKERGAGVVAASVDRAWIDSRVVPSSQRRSGENDASTS